ncbi:Monomethylxanthine methyltransferase 1 [Spatholobus suberectus]|nr:Monomethylxanthine methyltransferase 1 [Spatholobus suberectus]
MESRSPKMVGFVQEPCFCQRSIHSILLYIPKLKFMQQKVILKVKPILEESVKRLLHCPNFKSKLKMADLGCSSGPNAIMVMYDIITIIDNTKQSLNREAPVTVLQIYLNDLFENDFNNIFKLLPNFYQRVQERGDKVGACFVNATPGNFYGRLFPNNYIHFFHSSYSLHWLSQAPEELTKGTEPLNKGNIHITTTSSPVVYKAYFEQFQRDFKLFLKSRSDELKSGGIMVLTFIGREKAHEISSPWVVIGMVLKDMVLEGLVEEAKLDSFNLPIYGPTIEEVRQVIEAEGSFTLQTLKTFKLGWEATLQGEVSDYVVDSKVRGEFRAKTIRAVFEPLLTAEFGKDVMDELFSRFAKKVSQLIELDTLEHTNLVMSMRKA